MYIENALKRFKLHDANNTKTPLPAGVHLEKSEILVTTESKTYYQQMIRTLIYATIGTRPDIAFAAMRLRNTSSMPSTYSDTSKAQKNSKSSTMGVQMLD